MHLGHIQLTAAFFFRFVNIFLLLVIFVVFFSQISFSLIMVMKLCLCATLQSMCTTGSTLTVLENGLERKNFLFYVMVLKEGK